MGPCDLPGASTICDGVGSAIGSVASSAAQSFVDAFADGFAKLVATMTTFWVDVPTPALGGGAVDRIEGLVYWTQGFILVASLLWVAARTAMTRSGKAAGEAVVGLGGMVLVTGAGVATIDILAVAGDNWSSWIISQSVDGDMATRLGALTGGSANMAALGMGLTFVIALLGIVSCIVQIFFLIARIGILTVLAGTLPLSAAALATPAGKVWFKRSLGWIIAFLLYKPAAALIYASAFTLTSSADDLLSVLSGLMLILLAVFALPALMRLAVPMVSAASGGGGGELAGAAAGAALATGARRAAKSSGESGGHSGGSGQAGIKSSSGGAPSSAGPLGASAGAASGSAGASGAGSAGAGAAGGAAAAGGAVVGAGVIATGAMKSGAKASAASSAGES